MIKKIGFLAFVIFCLNLYSQEVPLETIEKELTQAEKDFAIAKKMFNPWYGGPLLTGSGNVLPPGYWYINPVLQVTDNYAIYNNKGTAQSVPERTNVNQFIGAGVGVVKRVDFGIGIQGTYQTRSGKSYTGFGDSGIKLSFALTYEGVYTPAMKISLREIFPTGKYKNLSFEKASVEAVGAGTFATEI